ncbi:MAG: cysteine--tRNA ligase [Candidatus Aminicenantes bacterium RBG_16_63_16]|nr:MAG: cysteine--tRNA ligase [Candidatus Aminicenantes bacterium RBG_16_63_16]
MINFFNTLSGKKEPFVPIVPREVKLYTCGPTVYDYAHIGNFRAYVFEDLLKRVLQFRGFRVTHIMNITDIDDKTIRGANARGVSLREYTEPFIKAFFEDIDRLKISRADVYPRATEHIEDMVRLIKGLVEKGYAYEREGSYYFSIAKFPAYGALSKINLQELEPGLRVDTDEYEKESVHDFALWKARKEGEPFWETELGPGRPGWHVECSAMSIKYLGEMFDLHTGGVDNIFPHHENEIAQSEGYTGKKFVNIWMHCHHLIRDGEKMAKSKGNTLTVRDVVPNTDDPLDLRARALRFLLLSTHYRKQLNFTFEALRQAEAALDRLNEFAGAVKYGAFPEGETQAVGKLIKDAEKKFAAGLSDDLNISVAMTTVFGLVKKVNTLIARGKIKKRNAEKLDAFIESVNAVLAVVTPRQKIQVKAEERIALSEQVRVEVQPAGEIDLPAEIKEKIQARENARTERNYALADQLRKELDALGFPVEDTKQGPRVVPRKRPT